MALCPKCGTTITNPIKTWPVTLKRQTKTQETKLIMAIYQCPNCKARFRTTLAQKPEPETTATIKNMVERIKSIRGELMQTLKTLREKIKTLETERANLMIEIDSLRKMAESRVDALEGEVDMLRGEVESLRDLLGHPEETEK